MRRGIDRRKQLLSQNFKPTRHDPPAEAQSGGRARTFHARISLVFRYEPRPNGSSALGVRRGNSTLGNQTHSHARHWISRLCNGPIIPFLPVKMRFRRLYVSQSPVCFRDS